MNLTSEIQQVFNPCVKDNLLITEKFDFYQIKYNFSNFLDFNQQKVSELLDLIKKEDEPKIIIKIGLNDAIILNKDIAIDDFFSSIEKEREDISHEDVELILKINKSTKRNVNIYNLRQFELFWSQSKPEDLLSLLKQFQNEFERNDFILLEEGYDEIYTNNISFSNSLNSHNNKTNLVSSETCHFSSGTQFAFPFNYFKVLESNSKTDSPIIETLDKFCLLYSIVSLFDITSIKEGVFYYKINGYKTFDGSLDISELDISLTNFYYKIANWVYSTNGNVEDKIGLSRNIMTLSLKKNSLKINGSVFISIQSGYKTYLQQNIQKYIEIRNKIHDELNWVSQKSGEIASDFLGNYQKSIFTYLSFFISVFLVKLLKSPLNIVFSNEVSTFSWAFLLLSVIYLIFSIRILNIENDRLETKYFNLKSRYSDLLDSEDIKRILNNDEEYKYEMNYIKERKRSYTLLWVITIIVLMLALVFVSENNMFESFIHFFNQFRETSNPAPSTLPFVNADCILS